ncbi:response regulator [Acidithiobacillus sulfurivorans]|uniref:Response regulator n=1 Tax=Acidithiobacillus sulfurivorans TaxID=1958756 RepID=A0ABS5ZYP9_9PROT|nr:response regulator [Acidithiobacillus sulfurivorans]MBU2760036.1 response regulator [Acidithiobacillus sulfurivorans]
MIILVAEDDSRNREMLVRRLLRRNYSVLEAENGLSVVEMAKAQHPDIILMDIAMPELNGWEALAQIHAVYPELPVIILSAHSMIDDQRRAISAGAVAYLSKPIDFDRLLIKIEQFRR